LVSIPKYNNTLIIHSFYCPASDSRNTLATMRFSWPDTPYFLRPRGLFLEVSAFGRLPVHDPKATMRDSAVMCERHAKTPET
ncbi:MAG: hypothetical protein WBM67_17200, partial [Sedimenticolaceae bacterium]